MKIELALCDFDDRIWRGLTLVEGELFKVNLFPGSATKEWNACLMDGGWTEVTEGNPLHLAIEREVERRANHVDEPSHNVTRSPLDDLHRLLASNPEAWEEVKAILSSAKGKQEGETE